MPSFIVSDRGPQFAGAFTREICRLIGTKQGLSTASHPYTDEQTECTNRTLEEVLRCYSHTDPEWGRALAAAEFAINSSVSKATNETPFMVAYGRIPPTPVPIRTGARVPRADEFLQGLQDTYRRVRTCLQRAQDRMKAYAENNRRFPEFAVDDMVLLSTKNLALKKPVPGKVVLLWVGPYKIRRRIGTVAYQLALPISVKVHDVFHVSLMAPYRSSGRVQPPPPPVDIDGDAGYEVARIINHRDQRVRNGHTRRSYLVEWTGYGPDHDQWLPSRSLANCPDKIRECETAHEVPVLS